MNPTLDIFLARARAVMKTDLAEPPLSDSPGQAPWLHVVGTQDNDWPPGPILSDKAISREGPSPRVHVGVDLGTAYTVLAVLDEHLQPLAGEYRFAQVVRDGLVVDFHGAISLVQELKRNVEKRLGFTLTSAATAYPPGVALTEIRATQHVIRAAGLECEQTIDEPTAANAVLQIRDGAVVDVGGGTTGIAIFRKGEVVYTADEPTGGTHFSLVIAGALGVEFEEAEKIKKNRENHQRLFPLVRPVMEKVGTIVARHVAAHVVEAIYLVGGTACFPGIDQVVEEMTGIRTIIPGYPLFVTPLGTAMYHTPEKEEVNYGR